jgi:hypothetical protein
MEQISGTKKYQNGIQVFWTNGGKELSDFFPFEELIDMKINAFDLLDNPNIYSRDTRQKWKESMLNLSHISSLLRLPLACHRLL